jgi:superfamily II DNA or RNA helicase
MPWVQQSPRDVAALMLNELFAGDRASANAPARTFPLTEFQEAAARRAGSILSEWGGVLIADSVGLGKTFIALALMEEALRRGDPVLLAIPAALRSVWRGPVRRLRAQHPVPEIHALSHAQLSRGRYHAGLAGKAGLVVVDEAHRFRNPRTRRYAALVELRGDAPMALLTATPINNSLADLHHLLRLFAADDAFVDLGVPSLAGVFDAVSGRAAGLRQVVREVVVRRTRSMVRTVATTGPSPAGSVRFPRRASPRVVRFADARIPRLATAIADLELAAYAVAAESTGDADGGGVAALVRLGLLKRLESGPAALAVSIQRQLSFSRAFLSALSAGRLLRPGRPAGSLAPRDMDPLQLVLVDLVAEPCPAGLDRGRILGSVQRDGERLRTMRRLLDGPDPKLDALRERLAAIAPEKAVVFTEFRDTAQQLWRGLASDFAVARIDGGGAWLGGHAAGRGAVVERFAPRANGVPDPPARERVDVLVVTDVLAEGANLQDARHVVCYDLPWNPVRLMQRIGRIDRLGSPHAEVVPHIFVPATGLEDLLGLTRRLREKLGTIADAMADDDTGQLLARLGKGGDEAASALERMERHDADPMEALRTLWQTPTHQGLRPGQEEADGAAASGKGTPVAWIDTGGDPAAIHALAVVRFRGRPWLVQVDHAGGVGEADDDATRLLNRALETAQAARPAVAQPDALARRVASAVESHFHSLDAAGRAPRSVRTGDPSAHLARTLRLAMAGPGVWAHPGLVARADRLLGRLDCPLPPGAGLSARRMTAAAGDGPAAVAELLGRMESLLDCNPADPTATDTPDPASRQGVGATGRPDTTLLAMILVDDVRKAR